jgi:hypothetical protein
MTTPCSFTIDCCRIGESPDDPPQPYCYADLRQLEALTGWTPTLSIEEGTKLTVAGFRATHV